VPLEKSARYSESLMPNVSVKHKSKLPDLKRSLQKLVRTDVAVGWVGANSSRPGDSITNPELAYILSNGSPLNNIPATPLLKPCIELPENQKLLTESAAKAAKLAVDGDYDGARRQLDRTGIMAENMVKRYFTSSGNGTWPKNRPSTIKQKGSSKRNIDTGQLRAAVTHVLRDKSTK
jgi:hypothetical protein